MAHSSKRYVGKINCGPKGEHLALLNTFCMEEYLHNLYKGHTGALENIFCMGGQIIR